MAPAAKSSLAKRGASSTGAALVNAKRLKKTAVEMQIAKVQELLKARPDQVAVVLSLLENDALEEAAEESDKVHASYSRMTQIP